MMALLRQRQSYWIGIPLTALVVLLTTYGILRTGHRYPSSGMVPVQSPANTGARASRTPPSQLRANAVSVNSKQWSLSWQDNFNRLASLNKWEYANGNVGGRTLGQLQWYDYKNVRIDTHGHLVITALANPVNQKCWYGGCRYSSARMDTLGLFSQAYGIFEARIKIPIEQGIWPAFWMEGANYDQVGLPAAGEIDIIELNGRETTNFVGGYAHAPHFDYSAHTTLAKPLSAAYHIYGVEWTPEGITWMVDGRAYAHMKAYPGWPFNHPFALLLDLAVGGRWPQPPNSTTHFPARMYVDWVRVYRHVAR
jgi:beta-glucanase (GH16 family)